MIKMIIVVRKSGAAKKGGGMVMIRDAENPTDAFTPIRNDNLGVPHDDFSVATGNENRTRKRVT